MEVHTLSLAGAWRLIAFEFRKRDGEVIHPFGQAARGSIIYTESGRYAAQLMHKDRPRFAAGDQMTGTVEEIEANYKGCISYFGTYELDLENRIVTHHVEGSIFPNMEGRDQIREFELAEPRLQLRTPPIKLDGTAAVGVLLWERAG